MDAGTGRTIQGVVVTAGPCFVGVPDARVQALGVGAPVITDQNGKFTLAHVPATYDLAVAASDGVVVYVGVTTASPRVRTTLPGTQPRLIGQFPSPW